ncbi:MAG: hypothetical protein R3E39_11640 [Anaerolineae bacterium]
METIHSEVPFGHAVYLELQLHGQTLDRLPVKNKIEERYLAWETVRRKTNPYFVVGTGFEGYLVGICPDAPAALEAVLAANQHILDAIARLYHFRGVFRSRLMRTLTRECSDPEAVHIWSAYLGAELGKLRVNIPRNKEATQFQTQTYRIVKALPAMSYHKVHGDVMQDYAVGSADEVTPGTLRNITRLNVELGMLPAQQQDAWQVATCIGEFGHPLVRECLDRDVWN